MKSPAAFLAAVALATAALATETPPTHDFLAAGAIDYRALVTPPPADNSIAGQADSEIVRLLDTHRTPEQAALAKHYEKFTVFVMMTGVLGPECTAENLPRTAAIFKQVYAETRQIIDDAKADWNRPRPYIANPALHPAVEKPNNATYPSGHAYGSSLLAALLSAALPEHAADWDRQAELVRWSRVVGAAHYPTDVIAGKILGEAVAREMLKSPKMRQALEEIRAEVHARLQKKAA